MISILVSLMFDSFLSFYKKHYLEFFDLRLLLLVSLSTYVARVCYLEDLVFWLNFHLFNNYTVETPYILNILILEVIVL